MLKKLYSTKFLAILSTLLLSSTLVFAGSFDPVNQEEQAQRTLRRMEILMAQVNQNAARLNVLAMQPGPSFRAHGFELEQAKVEMNDFADLLPKLEKETKGAEWTKKPMNRIRAKATALAAELETAIDQVNKLRSSERLIVDKQYQASLAAISRFSKDLGHTLDYLQSRVDMEGGYSEATSTESTS